MPGLSAFQKVFKEHIVGKPDAIPPIGSEVEIVIDHTLTQDATGTMAYLSYEALECPKVKTELSVSFVDHNMLQSDFRNADDHAYLQSVAAKYGILYSRSGNGICHQVFLERFARPGKTLLGSDSHTPTAGGVGAIAIGAGGLSVALAMAGKPFTVKVPKIIGVHMTNRLNPFCTAKDIILEILRIKTVKGGRGCVVEYFGPGIKTLSVPQRATITNMGAEIGATTSFFPSDEVTKEFLEKERRGDQWVPIEADADCHYDEIIELDLSKIEPLVAKPHMPDVVDTVRNLSGLKVNQVIIGSCTNSGYQDLMAVAGLLKGKKVHPSLTCAVAPGSRQVYATIARNGALADLIEAGVRILESACGPCIGMGHCPGTDSVTVRTFNRNFKGRCGEKSAGIYLVSPETAAACALTGTFTDPRDLGVEFPHIPAWEPVVDDSMVVAPPEDGADVEIVRGPNIKPIPKFFEMVDFEKEVVIKTGDDITTDDIAPAGAKVLPLRSNIPALSEFIFKPIDEHFVDRCKEKEGGIIVGGENYGQGSSREAAALGPLHLGIRAVIAKSFARIHMDNLFIWGITPLVFDNPADYDKIELGTVLRVENFVEHMTASPDSPKVPVTIAATGEVIMTTCPLDGPSIEVLLSGGAISRQRSLVKK
eukprot:gnl/Chilomastix_cuspidata/13.p2 GENE.gnl/Chilomastix_cuspidata/13~~gnl/Chilomastix_cuspidata/13.p2  ORF type:complete len:650 (-),score=333.31 gnl/Chilomastix_cuspidata/13:20-1969(-)